MVKMTDNKDECVGFTLKCNKCYGEDINIDFVEDVFFCNDCDNVMTTLDYGRSIKDRKNDNRIF